MKRTIGKRELVDAIYKRTNSAITKSEISDIITIICDYIIDSLLKNRAVSVKNFGTIFPSTFHSHEGFNLWTQTVSVVKSFTTAKFYPHDVFTRLIRDKKGKFLKK
jgi:nucleoid DNA-binding protein